MAKTIQQPYGRHVMRIKVTLNRYYGVVPCFTCDEPFELEEMSCFAYTDDGRRLGVICAECMKLDVDGIRARLSQRAELLHKHAIRFEELATGSIHLPSAEEYARVSELKMRLNVEGHEEIILS
jgi:hypothetical protein